GLHDGLVANYDVGVELLVSEPVTFSASFINGEPEFLPTVLNADGTYVLQSTVIDSAGNVGITAVTRTIDRSELFATLVGVTDGQHVAGPISVDVHVTSDSGGNIAAVVYTLDGVETTLPTVVTAEGLHTISVFAQHANGNILQQQFTFTLD